MRIYGGGGGDGGITPNQSLSWNFDNFRIHIKMTRSRNTGGWYLGVEV